jgi:photosystem II stability/assembly factor-like uncharacterized protein
MIKSVDGGNNWISKNVPDVDVQAIGFVTENHGWIGGHHTGFYETLDGGDTWTNTTVGSNLNRIFFISDQLACLRNYKCQIIYHRTFTEQDRIR